MLIVLKSHQGGLNCPLDGGVSLKLSGYGLIDNVDESVYKKAKEKYTFLSEWEKSGIIEVNQNKRKDDESFESAKKAQNEKLKESKVKASK